MEEAKAENHQEEPFSIAFHLVKVDVISDNTDSVNNELNPNRYKLSASIDLNNAGYGSSNDILISDIFLKCKGMSSSDVLYSSFKLFDVTNSDIEYQLCEVDRLAIDNCIAYRFSEQKSYAYQKLIGNRYNENNNVLKVMHCPILIPVYNHNVALLEDYISNFDKDNNVPSDSTQYSLELWSKNIKRFRAEFQFDHALGNNTEYELYAKLTIKSKAFRVSPGI